jgi:adenylate cyclase class 2
MLEVEMKFPVSDFGAVEKRLADWHAVRKDPITETDHYFNAPDRDFARTDEALRIRRIGTANYLTYKGPRLDLRTKTRNELETPLRPGDEAAEEMTSILLCLGYRPVAAVHKKRQRFELLRHHFSLEVSLDDVDEVGRFVEVEILAPDHELESARSTLLQVSGELGLSTSERRSYLEMLLTARQSKS